MVSVKIKVEAYPTTDVYLRYHGLGIDQSLNEDFWNSQPHKIIATTYAPFTYETTVDLPAGEHTAEYANSGYVPDYAWHAKIYVDDKLVGEGDAGRDKKDHLIVKFTVGAPTKATLNIDTTPVKGNVYLNGKLLGLAPQTIQVDPGTYTISFGDVPGYTKPPDQTVTVSAGETKTIIGTYTSITPPITLLWWLIPIIAGGVLGAVVGYAIFKRKA